MDGDEKFAITTLIIVCATVFGMACLLVSCGNDINGAIDSVNKAMDDTNAAINASRRTAQDVSPAIEHANGCPLDAVAYDTPAFANSWNDAYKVTDRFSGQSWWMVKMGRSWVVLPIESEETANVG